MIELRPYQTQIEDLSRASFKAGHHSVLVVAPTGSGKTVIFADIARGAVAHNNRVLVLVHRREIMEQTRAKLYDLGITAGMVAPGKPPTAEMVQVAMIQTLVRRLPTVRRPDLIIIDECFPGSEMVDDRKIKDLIPGDEVYSFDHSLGRIEIRKIASVFKRKYTGDWYRAILADGRSFICTENHPIYTAEYGYVPINYLTKHDASVRMLSYEMHGLRENSRTVSGRTENTIAAEILFPRVLHHRQGEEEDKETTISSSMQNMREASPIRKIGNIQCGEKKWARISRSLQKSISLRSVFAHNERDEYQEKGISFRENENGQSDEQSGDKGKSKCDVQGSTIQVSWWKWAIHGTAKTISGIFGASHGMANTNAPAIEEVFFSSVKLQSGHCRSFRKIGNRGGRESAWQQKMESAGREENGNTHFVRLERIEIHERGSQFRPSWVPQEDTVYNLEVEGNSNYFVNGLLVHNCHHVLPDNSHGRALAYWREVPRLGFTATPERLDGRGLAESFDDLIIGPTIAELVKGGFLSYPVLYAPPGPATDYHVKRGDFDTDEQQAAMSSRTVVGDVIQHYRRHFNGLPAICFCVNVEHSKLMARQFSDAGYLALPVYGDMPRADRDAALDGLREGRIQVITSCDLISEGFDTPAVAGVILLRRTMSLGLYLQQVGRSLRPFPGKTRALILDHAGNYALHGHVLAERAWSLNSQKRDPRKEKPPVTTSCPRCYGVWPGKPRACPGCGYEFKEAPARPAKDWKVIEGELVEAMPDLPPQDAASMAAFLARASRMDGAALNKAMLGKAFELAPGGEEGRRRLALLAQAVGRKPGWVRWASDFVRSRKHAS